MAPGVKRASGGKGNRLCVFYKFVVPAGVASYVFFVDTGSAHKAPFVMISAQPHLTYVVKRDIIVYLLW